MVIDCTNGNAKKNEGVDSYLDPIDLAAELLIYSEWLTTAAAFSTFATEGAPIIFDTGASLAITPDKEDSVEALTPLRRRMTLGRMANDLVIMRSGMVSWTFPASDGMEMQIRTQAYWVMGAKARLLSPQKLFNKKQGVFRHYDGDEDGFRLYLNNDLALMPSTIRGSPYPLVTRVQALLPNPRST
jgi:hypothetical protein